MIGVRHCKVLLISMKILTVVFLVVLGCWWVCVAVKTPPNSTEDVLEDSRQDRVVVTVYYETYCSDSQWFILDQLYPVHASLREKLVIDFVPFGKAKQSQVGGELKFVCQHGAKECKGNTIHACALSEACGEQQPQDCPWEQRARLMEFVFCTEEKMNPVKTAVECAKKAGLDADRLMNCTASSTGAELLSLHGNRTSLFEPPIGLGVGFVPYIAIDGVANSKAWEDLKEEICKQRPSLC